MVLFALSKWGAMPPLTVNCRKWLRHLRSCFCLLYTSDAADERSSVDLGGRRIIKKKITKKKTHKQKKKKTQHKGIAIRRY